MSGETVWVLPRQDGPDDAHGNPTYTWPAHTDPEAVEVLGASVSPRSATGSQLSSEPSSVANREAVIVGLMVFLPAGTRLAPVDRMHVRDDVYEVIGDAGVWVNPWTLRESGVQVALKRTEG